MREWKGKGKKMDEGGKKGREKEWMMEWKGKEKEWMMEWKGKGKEWMREGKGIGKWKMENN